jgi:hypothetical protein
MSGIRIAVALLEIVGGLAIFDRSVTVPDVLMTIAPCAVKVPASALSSPLQQPPLRRAMPRLRFLPRSPDRGV